MAQPAFPSGADSPFLPRKVRVSGRRRESGDTWTLRLQPGASTEAANEAAPKPRPGQFSMLYVFGVGEVPISFSALGRSADESSHTIRAVGPASTALARLQRGAALWVRGPFGSDWPLDEARGRDVLLVAGGLGLAPLRPAIQEIIAHRSEFSSIVLEPGRELTGLRTARERLAAGEIVSIRATGRAARAQTVPFLGGSARLATAPLRLARAMGAPLLSTFTTRHGPGRFEVNIEPPLQISGPLDDLSPFHEYSELLASYVRRSPDAWLGWQRLESPPYDSSSEVGPSPS